MAMARTLSRDAWRSSILWTSACRSPSAEAVQAEENVGLRWRRDYRMRLQPAPLHQPFAHPLLPRHGPHRRFPCPPGHRLPQPPRRPAPGAARGIGLREHLAALPATEPPLDQYQPYFLPPELRVPLPLQMPLVNLPRGAPTSRTGRLFLPALRRHLYPSGPLLDTKHLQPRQPQPNRDRVVLHLASFL